MAQSFWDMLRGKMPEEKALNISLQPGGFVNELRFNRPGQLHADTAALQGTLSRNELVFACISVKATAARDPRLIVQKRVTKAGKTTYEEVPGHPFRQLIMRPNAVMTESDLMKAAIVSWNVSNPRRFYCEKEYQGRLLVGLHPLNPVYMTPIIRDGVTTGYVWSDDIHRREYTLDELLIRVAPAWYDPPPLVAALGATESDSAQTDYIRAFFENGGIPSGFLKYAKGPLTDPQRNAVREKWAATYGNAYGRQHSVGVLDADTEYQEIGSKLDSLSSETLRSVAESRTCMVFGVPPLIVYAYVGLLRATYSNLKEAWAGFWDATMSPELREWRDFWTWDLLTEFEDEKTIRREDVRLHYDMSQVAALQEDVDAIRDRARKDYTAGLITQNEGRAAIGYDSVTGGDQFVPKPAIAAPMKELILSNGTHKEN